MSTSNLPMNPKTLLGAIQKTVLAHRNDDTGGVAFLKMGKSGIWVYGADEMEIEEESLWAVNPASFKTGYIAWEQGNTAGGPVGEEMRSITEDPLVSTDLPHLDGAKWNQQIGFQVACINGEDAGTQAVFKSSSKGARGAFDDLLQQLMTHYKANPGADKVVPVIELLVDSYKHKEYGKIYKPVFKIVEWATMEGVMQTDEPEDEPEPAVEPKAAKVKATPKKEASPRKRRRRAA